LAAAAFHAAIFAAAAAEMSDRQADATFAPDQTPEQDNGGKLMEKRPIRDRWPTLEEQLAEARVIPGSALDELIKENQEVGLLNPAELNDRWRLPPWIRIYFRKQHPELTFTGPQVGYPLALKELYEWMLKNQDSPDIQTKARKQSP
jgi:hypothetical protein